MPAVELSGPLDDAAVASAFAPYGEVAKLALAVSGGADSLALLVLADRWRRATGRPELVVLTVDHGLRPESASEANAVGAIAGALGLPFRALRWEGPYPAADIEAAARAARYQLLFAAARSEGASHLATAHHQDDQAETLLMRLARGSGAYGLAAMAPRVEREGIVLIRPLLGFRHADLVAAALAAGLVPADDPHNHDPRFARARLRQLMPQLAAEGLDAPTLAATATRLRRTASAIDHYVDRLLSSAANVDSAGAVRLEQGAWREEPEETRLRGLARILRAVGGAEYTPRLESLMALEQDMRGETDGPRLQRTLAGVVIDRSKGTFRFQREIGRTGLPQQIVADRFEGLWDGRFHLTIAVEGAPVALGALTAEGRRTLAVCMPDGLPRAMDALPALRRDGVILAVPQLGVLPEIGSGLTVEARSEVAFRLMNGIQNSET